MKKSINTAFIYSIIAMVFGVFYREFTKYLNFTGNTKLSVMHTHSFTLGMFMFLIVGLFIKNLNIDKTKEYKRFFKVYNLGLIITLATLFTRGMTEVLNKDISKAVDASISGIAGIGHLLLGLGIIFLFLGIKKSIPEN